MTVPRHRSGIVGLGPSGHGSGADDQQASQVSVAHFRDVPKAVLAPGRILSRHKAEEGRELSTRFEDGGIGDAGRQCRGGDDADTGNCLEPLAGCVLSMPGQKGALDVTDRCREAVKLRRQRQAPDPYDLGDLEAFATTLATDQFSNLAWSLCRDGPELAQMCRIAFRIIVRWQASFP